MTRIVIAGVPRAGKTTLAATMANVRHTDDLIGKLDWSAASLEVSRWLDEPPPWVIEGVAVGRALRKWLSFNPVGKPCDVAWWFGAPRVPLEPGQATMAKGCVSVWAEIEPALRARGVEIRRYA